MTNGRREGATRIEDELSLSCHLVLRRNWNGVRSTITLAFARDRVSGVRATYTRAHVHAYTRAHNRRLLSDEASDSGDCEVVACLESPAYI